MNEYDKKVSEDMASVKCATQENINSSNIGRALVYPTSAIIQIDSQISECISTLQRLQEQKKMLLEDPSLKDKLRKFNGTYIY